MANPTREDFIAAARARYSTQQQAPTDTNEQGIFSDTVDMFQRGLGQTLGGDLETVGQIADSQGIKDAGRGVSAWADSQLQEVSTPMREAMGKQFVVENEDGSIGAGDAWGDWRAWAGQGATIAGQIGAMVFGTKGAGLVARPVARKAASLVIKDTVKESIKGGALNSVRAAYAAAPTDAAKRAVLDQAIGRLGAIGYGAHTTAMASGMRAQQAEREAREYLNALGNDELNAKEDYQQAYWELADGEMQGASIGDIRRAAIDSIAERAATGAWSDPKAVAADFASGYLGGAFAGIGGAAGKVGTTRAGAAMRGLATEGVTESVQSGATQYAVNQAVQEWADETRDPMAGVLASALNEGVLGGAFGGVVGGVRGPEAQAASKPVVRVERRVVTGDEQMDDMIHGLDQRQAERGASISSEIDSIFAGARSQLMPGQSDAAMDTPAYQRQAEMPVVDELAPVAAPVVEQQAEIATAPLAAPIPQNDMPAFRQVDPIEETPAFLRQSIARAGSETDSVFGPLKTMRITKRGKPFASEKEAANASRKGTETPVPLNGGGFGVAEIAEVEQARSEQAAAVPQESGQEVRDNAELQPLVQAVDTGYREVIPAKQPQAEVYNEQAPQVLAVGSEGQGDQLVTGEPVAAGAESAITGLADRAGSGDPADYTAAPPVPDGQQQDDQTLTAPATDAGVAVSEVVQPEPVAPEPAAVPTPWAEAIDNPDGTITLKGEVPLIKQWAKDSGVKAIPGKGGMVVAKSSAAKVREYVAPTASEPVQQIEAARAEVAPEPTEAQKEAGNYKKGHLTLQGLDIALENPKGSTRSGTDKDGKAWQSTMAHDYGYIKRTMGADGDHVDVFIGDQPDSETVYVVDQVDPKTGKFDEHKVMMGFADEQAARDGYLANYEKGWKGLSAIKAMPLEEFKRWVKDGDTTKPVADAAPAKGSEQRKAQKAEAVKEPERAITFSKQAMAQGEKPAKHLTRKEAELVTKEWFKQYRGASGIDVQIHATQSELEQALGLAAKDGLIRRAAFDDDNGTLHVAADTIANPKRMREILRHEVLAHYGLANVLGDGEYTKLISRLIKSRNDQSMKAVWDWVDTHYADEELGVQAEEVVAHLAELEQSAWRRGWDQVVAWVTKALRVVGFLSDGVSAAEVRSLIEGLGKKMKRGGPDDSGPDGGQKFSQEAAQPEKKGGIKMSQTSTAADAAMEKLNLGPKPDVIDKTKANLDKLRKVERSVVKSWVDRFIKKANTEVLDALAPIKYAEDAAGITDAADSGYVSARMATGAASTMQATMLYGLPEWKDGVIQRKAGTGEKDALLGIFSDLGADLHNWLGWMAGHRAELLMEQGRENLLSEQDIAALKGLGKGKEAKFKEAKARWNRLNAATLDLAQEAGLFTKEARAEFENEWYIPFFRESDDGDVIAPFKPKGIANQNAGIKKLKGGEANTNDLLENIFTSTSKLIDASMKNMAAQKTVWNLADTGLIEVVAKPNMMDWRALKNGKDLITVKLEGEDYMIRIEDPDLYRAMTFFDRQPFGAMVNMASKAKRLLTAGVTASPEFMLRNFLRDSLSSWAISKDGFTPVIDSLKGVRKTWRMEGSTIDVMFSGASFLGGYVNGNDPEAMADTVRKSLRRKGMTPEQITKYEKSLIRNAAQAKGVVADVWEKYNRLGEAVENGNREAVYEAAIKAGKSHAQAAFESKDLMDFSMLGAARFIQGASLVLPFFNARIQGLGKLSRELRDNPREIAKRAGMITAMSLGLLAMNWDDERYEELPDWDKDANWHIFVGDQHFRIPKPFEIGVMFGTIPERMVRAMGGKDTGAQFGKAVARAVGDTFALNPTPQIVKPIVEAAFNYDSFRGGPIDNAQDLAVKAEARYNEQTSLLMRELGELSGFSPKQLEHLVIGYTGTIGGYVMAAADGLIRASRPGESASWRADEIPLVKAVYRGTGPAKSTQHMEQFYQMLNEVNQLKRTVDQYRSEGLDDKAKDLLDEQGGILKSRSSLSRTQQQIRVLRNRIELLQRDKVLSADEKRRRIDELLSRRNDLVYQAVNRNRKNWE
ncbi:LPD38 domain-containing protein [Aeromonas veronii]